MLVFSITRNWGQSLTALSKGLVEGLRDRLVALVVCHPTPSTFYPQTRKRKGVAERDSACIALHNGPDENDKCLDLNGPGALGLILGINLDYWGRSGMILY
jgi:hypothetical protein